MRVYAWRWGWWRAVDGSRPRVFPLLLSVEWDGYLGQAVFKVGLIVGGFSVVVGRRL